MRTTGPAAGTLLSFGKVFDRTADSLDAGGSLFGGSDPADPLIPSQRGDRLPRLSTGGVRVDCVPEVGGEAVDGAWALEWRRFSHGGQSSLWMHSQNTLDNDVRSFSASPRAGVFVKTQARVQRAT